MKKNLTELVFILDRSGSMAGLEADTIGGYNSLLAKQQKEDGECVITTVLFDHNYQLLHDRIDIRAIKPLTQEDYYVSGTTALLDAIGKTIQKIATVQKNTAKDYRAQKVMFVIITDGAENSSRHFSSAQIKKMINQQKERFGWEFIFIGANIDAVETAARYGIDSDRAVDYVADSEGTELTYSVMCETVSSLRRCGSIKSELLDEIREDNKKRGKH